MRLRAAVAAAVAVGLAPSLLPSPAAATPGVEYRFESANVCIKRDPAGPGWRVYAAARMWNTTGLVNFAVRADCDSELPNVVMHVYEGPTDKSGYVDYESTWQEGHPSPDGQTWLYRSVGMFLNNSVLRLMSREFKKCWAIYTTAHELGHALGLPHSTGKESVMSYGYDYLAHCKTLRPVDAIALAGLHYQDPS